MQPQTDTVSCSIPQPEEMHYKTWRSIKTKYAGVIVLLRLEDYYFCFDDDAFLLSGITAIAQTASKTNQMQSCFPFHQLDHFLHQLVKAGHRVAICDQLAAP